MILSWYAYRFKWVHASIYVSVGTCVYTDAFKSQVKCTLHISPFGDVSSFCSSIYSRVIPTERLVYTHFAFVR